MAYATLAGVNPVFGLYNMMVGTPIAALFTISVYMAVVTASAFSLVAYDALAAYSGEEQVKALVTSTLHI
jgi:SulP family sulfate permease